MTVVTATTLAIPAAAPYGGTAVAADGRRPSPVAGIRLQRAGDAEAASAESFWTSQRMRDAVTADGNGNGTGDASTGTESLAATGAGGPRVGRLFYHLAGRDYGCTGTVVTSHGRDAVLTAGHCLNLAGIPVGRLMSVFVPGYDGGRAPYGIWGVTGVWVPRSWALDQNIDYDYGIVRVRAHGAVKLAQVTGADPYRLRAGWTGRATLTGYPNGLDRPALCRNTAYAKKTIIGHKPEYRFDCEGFTAGVSGSALLVGPGDTAHGKGTVIGVLGGLRGGGDPAVDGDTSFANRLDGDFADFWSAYTR